MINAKLKIIFAMDHYTMEESVNEFLQTIDVRQVVKIDTANSQKIYIFYLDTEDFREIKLNNLLS